MQALGSCEYWALDSYNTLHLENKWKCVALQFMMYLGSHIDLFRLWRNEILGKKFKALKQVTFFFFYYFKLIFFYPSAPGSYDVEKADKKVHGSSPAYSIKGKPKEKVPEQSPGIALNLIKLNKNYFLRKTHF